MAKYEEFEEIEGRIPARFLIARILLWVAKIIIDFSNVVLSFGMWVSDKASAIIPRPEEYDEDRHNGTH